MSHADTIREALATAQRAEAQLAGEFASTDPSDAWTQRDVYEHVYLPLSGHLLRVVDLAAALLSELERKDEALRVYADAPEPFANKSAVAAYVENFVRAPARAALAAAGPEQGATKP